MRNLSVKFNSHLSAGPISYAGKIQDPPPMPSSTLWDEMGFFVGDGPAIQRLQMFSDEGAMDRSSSAHSSTFLFHDCKVDLCCFFKSYKQPLAKSLLLFIAVVELVVIICSKNKKEKNDNEEDSDSTDSSFITI